MIHFLLLLVLSGDSDSLFCLLNTEIYDPRVHGLALQVGPERFVISDTKNHQLRFFKDGRLEKTVGQAGQGPGDLQYPSKLQILGDKLYVTEIDNISVFSHDGSFIKKVRMPFNFIMDKVESGWIVVQQKDDQLDLNWFDEELNTQKTIFSAAYEPGGGFNPVSKAFFHRPDKSGRYVFISHPEQFLILIMDSRTQQIVKQIEKEQYLIPFDLEWGKQQFEQMSNRIRAINPRLPTPAPPSFPDYFPPIKMLYMDVNNQLLVLTHDQKAFGYNLQGEEVKPEFPSADAARRILGRIEGFVYVLAFPDGQVGIARVPLGEVSAFFEKYPNH